MCAAYHMGTGECAPLTVGVAVGAAVGDRVGADVVGNNVGAVAQAQSLLLPTIYYRAQQYPVGSSLRRR